MSTKPGAGHAALKKRGRLGLDLRWTISPSGGVDKVWPFVSLFAGKHLNVTVLTDLAAGIKKNVERLKNSKLLANGRVMTAADFVDKPEADIEDLFEPELWADIVNKTYGLTGARKIKAGDLKPADGSKPRLLHLTESHFKLLPAEAAEFDHFAPAAWLIENAEILNADTPMATASLDRFQKIFDRIKEFLPKQ